MSKDPLVRLGHRSTRSTGGRNADREIFDIGTKTRRRAGTTMSARWISTEED
jgi:hypothetical protein